MLASKAAALVVLTGVGALALWGAAGVGRGVVDVAIEGWDLGARVVGLFITNLLCGCLALGVGPGTGKAAVAVGGTTGGMVLSWIAAGLFPVITGFEGRAKVFPWYYYDAGRPVLNGVDWGRLSVLLGGIAVFAVVAWFAAYAAYKLSQRQR